MKMQKRQIAKFAVKAIVTSAVGSAVTKAVLAAVPSSEQYHIAEIVGSVSGYVAGNELKPYTDKAVDVVADKIVAHKQKNEKTLAS